MFTPDFDTPCFFQLNDNDPCKAQINHHVERNYFNITIFQKDGSVYDNRDVNLSDGTCKFFDAPINSKHYFQILCLAYDAYDALCDHYLDISFDIDEITILSETYQKSNRQLFHNPEFMVCVKKVD